MNSVAESAKPFAERRVSASQSLALEQLATGAPLERVLETLCLGIEEHFTGTLSSVLLLDAETRRLRHGAAPSLPAAYVDAINGVAIGPSVGSCGTAAHFGRPIVVEDIATDPLWVNFRDLALAHELRACWSVPIRDSRGGVIGTFALYYRETRAPATDELRLIERFAHVAGIAIAQRDAEQELRATRDRLQTILDSSPLSILAIDTAGRIIGWNRGAERMFGWTAPEAIGRVCPTVPEDGLDDFHDMLRRVLEGEPWVGKVRLRRMKDGKLIRASLSAAPIPNGPQGPRGVVVILEDVTERDAADEMLRSLIDARERLMQDLHDGCIQAIYAIGLNLEECRRTIAEDPQQAARQIGDAVADLNLVIQDLRGFITGNEREPASARELPDALARVLQRVAKKEPAFASEIDPHAAGALSDEQARQLLNIAREAVSNSVRHSGGRSGRLALLHRDSRITLEVSDNGRGFDARVQRPGLGLYHIAARARKIGAHSRIDSAAGHGTRIVIDVPLRAGPA